MRLLQKIFNALFRLGSNLLFPFLYGQLDKLGFKLQKATVQIPAYHKYRQLKRKVQPYVITGLVLLFVVVAILGSNTVNDERRHRHDQAAAGLLQGQSVPVCAPGCTVTVTELPRTSATPVPTPSPQDDGVVTVNVMGVQRQLPNLGPSSNLPPVRTPKPLLTTWTEVGNQFGTDHGYIDCTQSLGPDASTWEMNEKSLGGSHLMILAINFGRQDEAAARKAAATEHPELASLTANNTLPVKFVPYAVTARGPSCETVYDARPNHVAVFLLAPGYYPPPLVGIDITTAAPVRLPDAGN